jgi:hypothetical protein
MTVAATITAIQLPCNGVTTQFSFNNKIFQASDLTVMLYDTFGNGHGFTNQANVALGLSYTVQNVDVDTGCIVVFNLAPTNGWTMDLRTSTPQTQSTSIKNQGAFLPELHEEAFDRLTRVVQDLTRRTYLFGIHGPDTETTQWPTLPLPAARAGFGLVFDSTTGLPTIGALTTVPVTAQLVGSLLYAQTSYEIAAGVTPANYLYPPGWLPRYGGVADGGTDCTTALQNALSACAGAVAVYVPCGTNFYKITARVTAPANAHLVLEEGAELRWTATTANGTSLLGTPTRPGIEVMGSNVILEGKGKLTGPGTVAANSGAGGGGVTSFVGNEFAILSIGPSANSRRPRLTLRDLEISLWGQGGIATQFCQNIAIVGCWIHDVGYQGIVNLSAQGVRVHRNTVYGIAPGTAGNAYGITHSHDSTNYSSDPNVTAAPRQTVNPFCIDVDVGFNEVRDVPLWTGIDFHGAYDSLVHHNRTYNCHRGIQVSSSSNAGLNYAGENNAIVDNVVYGPQINGNATTDLAGFQAGIVVNGGSVLTHRGITVRGNHIYAVGHALVTPSVYVLEASLCNDLVIADNTFRACLGRMIYMNNTSGSIHHNQFDSVGASATGSNLVYIDSNCGPLTITGNIHQPLSGTLTVSNIGINTPGSGYTRMVVADNDFNACTTPYTNINGTFTRGLSTITPQITDSTTGSHTVDAAPLGNAPRFILVGTQTLAATLTSILNPGNVGQECVIVMTGSNTLTVNNSGNIRLQGGTAALTNHSTLTLEWSSGGSWEERSRTIGNT